MHTLSYTHTHTITFTHTNADCCDRDLRLCGHLGHHTFGPRLHRQIDTVPSGQQADVVVRGEGQVCSN
jgi:hypothetical protein